MNRYNFINPLGTCEKARPIIGSHNPATNHLVFIIMLLSEIYYMLKKMLACIVRSSIEKQTSHYWLTAELTIYYPINLSVACDY